MRKRVLWLLVIVVVLAVGLYVWRHWYGEPEDFTDMEAEYKYGSIGSDHPRTRAPIPYWIFTVLPEMFPPSKPIGNWYQPRNVNALNDPADPYAAFGLVTEADNDMARPRGWTEGQTVFKRPIGFSKRTFFGIDFIGVNCAFCHTTTLRKTREDKREIIVGGTGNTVDIEQFFLYLLAATTDKRFNTDEVMKEVKGKKPDMNFLEQIIHRLVIYFLPSYITELKQQFDFIDPQYKDKDHLAEFGPGRVDTWAPYKRVYIVPPDHDRTNRGNRGIVDFPPIWNQKARAGTRMHWDGNTDVLEERNIISGLALIGKRLEYLDFPRVNRMSDYITWLIPPGYADRAPTGKDQLKSFPVIRDGLAKTGGEVFKDHCATCHAPEGGRIGRVEPIQGLGTDPFRMQAFTPNLADALNRLGTDEWKLRNFKLQHGYVNTLLDGIWLRAPYLHNGSVPTLRDLLNIPEDRPKKFCTGYDVYDGINVGFVTPPMHGNKGAESCGEFFLYNTAVDGNSNKGHLYGTSLSVKEKDALIEFLKTL